MIENEAHKNLLTEDFSRRKELAEKYRERGQFDQAATHYRTAADLLDQIAELESSDRLATERQDLADNYREAAHTLEDKAAASHFSESPSTDSEAQNAPTTTENSQQTGQWADAEHRRDASAYLEDPPALDFEDVGGMTDLKQTLIDKVVDPLERPELYEKYDLGVVNGVLLYGPPGTGKTYITRALAGKLDYNFIEVTPTDITSSLVGEAADNIAAVFDVARNNQPCLVFIDEIDAIAAERSGGAQKTQSERQIVNQLLTELTEIQGEDVIVVAATNLLDAVDDAIKRSGRFDERIEVPPPDGDARVAILRIHLRNRPVLVDEIDWDDIRDQTTGYSASDMELIATNAARKALQEAREQEQLQHITQPHLEEAIAETESSLQDRGE